MAEDPRFFYCRETGDVWGSLAGEPCTDSSHAHYDSAIDPVHRHRSAVVLPNGTAVMAVSFDPNDAYTREGRPDFGLYLDHNWSPPWEHDHVQWPDFSVPVSADELRDKLTGLLERARRGALVEMGCLGSHGRTGTALACLAILAGVPPTEAVAWVRSAHCEKSVETPEQAAFVTNFTR